MVLYLGINDNIYNTFPWVDEIPDVGYFDWRSPRSSLLVRMVRYHLFEKRLWSRPDFGPGELRSVAILAGNVEAMVDAASTAGARVVLCSFAVALPTGDHELEARIRSQETVMEHFWGRVDSTLLGVAAHNQAMSQIAARRGLALAPVVIADSARLRALPRPLPPHGRRQPHSRRGRCGRGGGCGAVTAAGSTVRRQRFSEGPFPGRVAGRRRPRGSNHSLEVA